MLCSAIFLILQLKLSFIIDVAVVIAGVVVVDDAVAVVTAHENLNLPQRALNLKIFFPFDLLTITQRPKKKTCK